MVYSFRIVFPTILLLTFSVINAQGFNIPQPVFTAPQNNNFSAQPSQQVQSLSHYLKSKFLGITIDYVDQSKYKGYDDRFKLEQGDVLEIITNQSGHFMVLDDGTRVKIEYEVSQSGDPSFIQEMNGTNQQALQMQVLQTQAFINQSLASIGSQGSTDASSALLANAQSNYTQNQTSSFTSTEEIIYTDLRDNRKKKSGAIANLDGVFLSDGSPVNIKFVKEDK